MRYVALQTLVSVLLISQVIALGLGGEGFTGCPPQNGDTLYVGGYGEGNYSTIGAAIENASNGDIIFIYPGTYRENVVVDRSVSVIGYDAQNVVVDGSGHGKVFEVVAGNVRICNLTIRYAGNEGDNNDAEIYINSDNNIIENNLIAHSFGDSNTACIYLDTCSGNIIRNNSIKGNYFGIDVYQSSQNTIYGNHISQQVGFGGGIHISARSTSNEINNNVMEGKGNTKDVVGIGIFGDKNSVANNEIHGYSRGIDAWLAGSENNISGNNIYNNGYGIYMGYDFASNRIAGNRIHNNDVGLFLTDGCRGNIIEKNNVTFNRLGINTKDAAGNTIRRNNIMWNLNNAYVFYYIRDFPGNRWINNYWGRPHMLPKMIPCIIGLRHGIILGFEIDWRPALLPNI